MIRPVPREPLPDPPPGSNTPRLRDRWYHRRRRGTPAGDTAVTAPAGIPWTADLRTCTLLPAVPAGPFGPRRPPRGGDMKIAAVAAGAVLLAAASFAVGQEMASTGKGLVATYDSIADCVLGAKKAEKGVVRAILET